MSCQTCGHPPETVNGERAPQGHNVGCAKARAAADPSSRGLEPREEGVCEHGECSNQRRPQGKGPKPKYCDEHSTPKSRKE